MIKYIAIRIHDPLPYQANLQRSHGTQHYLATLLCSTVPMDQSIYGNEAERYGYQCESGL